LLWLAKVAFVEYGQMKCHSNKVLVKERETYFLARVADNTVVPTKVALTESLKVEFELFNEARMAVASKSCCMALVASE
jgi:hypothetical protein